MANRKIKNRIDNSKKYFKYLDIIRIFFCIAVLLYHLGILNGGYLAVCSFFVLSGYLSFVSLHNKDKLSFKEYYKNRFMKIYLPLVVVVFLSIGAIKIFGGFGWFNLKPETTSVLLGYNNIWQLNANLDYFARHVNSPFMHFWYVAILLQFDLIFPLIYLVLKKLKDKFNKMVPLVISSLFAFGALILFYISSIKVPMMVIYYNTFCRVFSLLFGVLVGVIHSYFDNKLILKNKIHGKFIFWIYLVILCLLFYFVISTSIYFNIAMIIVSLITCRLIDYSVSFNILKVKVYDKGLKYFSSISYEVYLVQYPLIFLMQYNNLGSYIKYILIIILILFFSISIHFIFEKKDTCKIFRNIVRVIFFICVVFGIYSYIVSKDYTKDMRKLENNLAENAKMNEEKLKNYKLNLEKEKEELERVMANIENDEANLDNYLSNMAIVGVGDSIMLGATPTLYNRFPNGYFDAKKSRTAWKVNDILVNLKNSGRLSDVILINVGANGDCPDWCKQEIMNTTSDKKVFWVNVTNDRDVNVNERLNNLALQNNNLYIIDWNTISRGHPEYFIADGIHLTDIGSIAYVNAVYDNIKKVFLEEYKNKKEYYYNQVESDKKKRTTIFGNDLMVNLLSELEYDQLNVEVVIDKDFNYEKLKDKLIDSMNDESLNYKIILGFDNNFKLSEKQLNELAELCNNHKIYFIKMDNKKYKISSNTSIEIIDFYKEIKNNDNYLMVDKIHLTSEGNIALVKILNDVIK